MTSTETQIVIQQTYAGVRPSIRVVNNRAYKFAVKHGGVAVRVGWPPHAGVWDKAKQRMTWTVTFTIDLPDNKEVA